MSRKSLELIEHPLGAVTLAVLGHLVELVEHRLKVALAEHLHVAVGLLRARILLGALGKLADIAVERLAKLGHALLDLLLGGAVGERILQGVLGGPKRVERPRRAVAFDDQCEFPQIGRDIAKLVIVHGRGKALSDRPQADVDAGFRHEFFRRDHERVEGLEHLRTRVGIERELAPLLDERACQRLGEGMRRQGEAHRIAGALEPGLVLGGEPKRHVGSCPRVGGKIEGVACGRRSGSVRRRGQIGHRRLDEGVSVRHRMAVPARIGEAGLDRGDAVFVRALVAQGDGAANVGLGVAHDADGRRLVRD